MIWSTVADLGRFTVLSALPMALVLLSACQNQRGGIAKVPFTENPKYAAIYERADVDADTGWSVSIAKVVSLEDDVCRDVDELEDAHPRVMYCGMSICSYTQRSTDRHGANLIVRRFVDPKHTDTLLRLDYHDSTHAWYFKEYPYNFMLIEGVFLPESLLVVSKHLLRLNSDTSLTPIRDLSGHFCLQMSYDHQQLISVKERDTVSEDGLLEVFDIQSDSAWVVPYPITVSSWPQRASVDTPIYYLLAGSDAERSNIFRVNDNDTLGEQLTHYQRPEFVAHFYLMGDSLVYYVTDRDDLSGGRYESIPIP